MRVPAVLRRLLGSRPPARIVGHLDRVERRRVVGWAASRVGEPLAVLLVADGRPVAVTTALDHRPDLADAGIGDGRHGFAFSVPNLRAAGVRNVEVFALHERTTRELGIVDAEGRLGSHVDAGAFEAARRAASGGLARLGRVELPAPSPAGPPHPRPDGPVTFLEIYDLLAFLESSTRPTGIQRVICGLIEVSLDDPSRYPPFAFCTLTDLGEIVVLPETGLLALVDTALRGRATQAELVGEVEALRATARRAEIRPGDRYVVTGAYWIIEDYGRVLARLRRRGVTLGAYVYDLIPITASRTVLPSTHEAVASRGIEVLTLCDVFLTISVFVEGQLRTLLSNETGRVPPTRAVLLPHGLPGGESEVAWRGAGHPRPYVLCVGTLEARKNHVLLFEVWAALIRRHGADAVPDLVLVGKWGWLIDDFRARCEATGFLAGKIVVRHDVDDAELLSLYRNCLFTTFPSVAEGWGLPVGESLAVGKLCIASHATSIPEVGGALVDYVDPHDALGAGAVFERAIYDAGYRAEREREIATSFRARTWRETTDAFHAGLHELTAQAGGDDRRVPQIPLGTFHDLTGLMADVTRPWAAKAAKLALAEGWHELEKWGAWSAAPSATLVFFTDARPGDRVVATLRLRPPPGLDDVALALGERDQRAEVRLSEPDGQDVEVDVVAGEAGEVEIALLAEPGRRRSDGLRDLHVGLLGFGVAATGQGPGRR